MTEDERLRAFARSISNGPMGLVRLAPEPFARALCCFANVAEKIARASGRPQTGWTFEVRVAPIGRYLLATHHVVWRRDDGTPIDITPLHEKQHPICDGSSILFLVDDDAQPVVVGIAMGPRPSKYWPLDDSPALRDYVGQLDTNEWASHAATFASAVPKP